MPTEVAYIIRDFAAQFLAAAVFTLAIFSPVGKAIGHRIKHGRVPDPNAVTGGADAGRMDDLSDEVAAMRQQLHETQERLDFTERMLAQAKERGVLSAPKDA